MCQIKSYESEPLGHTVCSSPDMRRLYLGCVDFANDPPSCTICEAEHEDGNDDYPSSNSEGMHRTRGIEGTNQKHDA